MTELIDAKRVICEDGESVGERLKKLEDALEALRAAAANTEEE